MPSGFIFLKSQKTHVHIPFVSAHVQDDTHNKSYCLPVSGNAWPLHMTKEAPWDCLWPWEGGWVRSGNPKERGDSCSVIPEGGREGGRCVCHPALLKGWHIQGFLGRKKYCSPFTHPRHHPPAPEWWRMVSHGVMLVGQLESLPAIIQLQVLKSLGQRQFSLLCLFCA